MSFTKSTEPKDNGESRVFYRASAIECHQNDVFYKGSTNSVSVINIACPLRSPQSQRTTRKSRVFSRASTIECHQNDVFYERSTNSISVINIACPLTKSTDPMHGVEISCLLHSVHNRNERYQNDPQTGVHKGPTN